MHQHFYHYINKVFIATGLVSLIILMSIQPATSQQTAQQSFEAANAAYQNGDYASAIEAYNNILASGKHSATLYFNLANAHAQQQELGYAILFYEKACRLNPHFEAAKANKAIIENRLKDNITPIPQIGLVTWWQNTYHFMSPIGWFVCAMLFSLMAIVTIGIWLIHPNRSTKRRAFGGTFVVLIISLLTLGLGYGRHLSIYGQQDAVIVAKQTDLKNGADADSQTAQTLHEGVVVKRVDQIGDWEKVRLANGEEGWIAQKDLQAI